MWHALCMRGGVSLDYGRRWSNESIVETERPRSAWPWRESDARAFSFPSRFGRAVCGRDAPDQTLEFPLRRIRDVDTNTYTVGVKHKMGKIVLRFAPSNEIGGQAAGMSAALEKRRLMGGSYVIIPPAP
jgi:hypothetical protein